jgi:hypothetical protein
MKILLLRIAFKLCYEPSWMGKGFPALNCLYCVSGTIPLYCMALVLQIQNISFFFLQDHCTYISAVISSSLIYSTFFFLWHWGLNSELHTCKAGCSTAWVIPPLLDSTIGATPPALFCDGFFGIGSPELFAWAGFNGVSPDLCLLSS